MLVSTPHSSAFEEAILLLELTTLVLCFVFRMRQNPQALQTLQLSDSLLVQHAQRLLRALFEIMTAGPAAFRTPLNSHQYTSLRQACFAFFVNQLVRLTAVARDEGRPLLSEAVAQQLCYGDNLHQVLLSPVNHAANRLPHPLQNHRDVVLQVLLSCFHDLTQQLLSPEPHGRSSSVSEAPAATAGRPSQATSTSIIHGWDRATTRGPLSLRNSTVNTFRTIHILVRFVVVSFMKSLRVDVTTAAAASPSPLPPSSPSSLASSPLTGAGGAGTGAGAGAGVGVGDGGRSRGIAQHSVNRRKFVVEAQRLLTTLHALVQQTAPLALVTHSAIMTHYVTCMNELRRVVPVRYQQAGTLSHTTQLFVFTAVAVVIFVAWQLPVLGDAAARFVGVLSFRGKSFQASMQLLATLRLASTDLIVESTALFDCCVNVVVVGLLSPRSTAGHPAFHRPVYVSLCPRVWAVVLFARPTSTDHHNTALCAH